MQHRVEGGGGGEEGDEGEKVKKIPKPLEGREKEEEGRREGASEVEEQVGRYGSKGMGVLERRQAGGGATFKRKNINKEFEFQSSSKMMSVSQKKKTSFHHITNQLKHSQKEKESCWCL